MFMLCLWGCCVFMVIRVFWFTFVLVMLLGRCAKPGQHRFGGP
jgi:hypothetical protein